MTLNMETDRSACREIAETLSKTLANTYILYVKTQNFHWNVIDPRFHSLHEFFEEQYEELAEAVDTIAERIRVLHFKALGSMREFLTYATLEESESNLTGDQMLKQLLKDHEQLISEIRPQIEECLNLGDQGNSDMLIQRLKAHEKTAWMIRSHLNQPEQSLKRNS